MSRLIQFILALLRRLFGGAPLPATGPLPPKFLHCPNDREEGVGATIGPEGGTLQVGEHRLTIPRDAVPQPVQFTATILADRILKVRFEADGKSSYTFLKPATLTLGYAKCERPSDPRRLRIYKIDPQTNGVQRDLDGSVDEKAQTVTATTETLSVYTLGTPP